MTAARASTDDRVDRALAAVHELFPFAGHVDDCVRHEMRAVAHALERQLGRLEGRRLLDVGCGPMDKTGVLAQLGLSCFAVDDLGDPWHRRDDNAARIESYAAAIGVTFHRQHGGRYDIPFPRDSFDVVTALDVIEHLHESPRELLNTMGAHAVTGGLIVVVMPNAVNLRKRLAVAIGRSNHVPVAQLFHSQGTWRGHVREYTLGETRYICEQAGFEVVTATTFEHYAYRKLAAPVRQLYLLLGALVPTVRSGLLVIARKPASWTPRVPEPLAPPRQPSGRDRE